MWPELPNKITKIWEYEIGDDYYQNKDNKADIWPLIIFVFPNHMAYLSSTWHFGLFFCNILLFLAKLIIMNRNMGYFYRKANLYLYEIITLLFIKCKVRSSRKARSRPQRPTSFNQHWTWVIARQKSKGVTKVVNLWPLCTLWSWCWCQLTFAKSTASIGKGGLWLLAPPSMLSWEPPTLSMSENDLIFHILWRHLQQIRELSPTKNSIQRTP